MLLVIILEKTLWNNKYFINSDFCIEMNHISDIAQHTHDFIEFVYMVKGTSVHIVDGCEYPLKSGDLLIINYNQTHSFNGDTTAQFCNILIKPSFIDKSLQQCTDLFVLFDTSTYEEFKELIDNKCNLIHFSSEEKNCFEYMLLLLNKEIKDKDIGYTHTTQAGVNFLLTMIFRKMCKTLTSELGDFKTVLEYINSNYRQKLSARHLAESCHYNSCYFSRIFKKYTGVTFTEYVKKVRIIKACQLLAEKDAKVNDIYDKIGYTNKTNFYKHFKQITGVTPLEYKKIEYR